VFVTPFSITAKENSEVFLFGHASAITHNPSVRIPLSA
jgi:hypothetical protein